MIVAVVFSKEGDPPYTIDPNAPYRISVLSDSYTYILHAQSPQKANFFIASNSLVDVEPFLDQPVYITGEVINTSDIVTDKSRVLCRPQPEFQSRCKEHGPGYYGLAVRVDSIRPAE